MAALLNACLVLAATYEIVHDGIEQLGGNEHPSADIMLVVAIGALIVNGISVWLLHGAAPGHAHHGHDILDASATDLVTDYAAGNTTG